MFVSFTIDDAMRSVDEIHPVTQVCLNLVLQMVIRDVAAWLYIAGPWMGCVTSHTSSLRAGVWNHRWWSATGFGPFFALLRYHVL